MMRVVEVVQSPAFDHVVGGHKGRLSVDNCLWILITEAKAAAESNGGSIVDRFKAAKQVAKSHWLVTDEDDRLSGAIVGVMGSYGRGTPEFERIEKEACLIRHLSTMMQAGAAGLSVTASDLEDGFEPVGLLKLWLERCPNE